MKQYKARRFFCVFKYCVDGWLCEHMQTISQATMYLSIQIHIDEDIMQLQAYRWIDVSCTAVHGPIHQGKKKRKEDRPYLQKIDLPRPPAADRPAHNPPELGKRLKIRQQLTSSFQASITELGTFCGSRRGRKELPKKEIRLSGEFPKQ